MASKKNQHFLPQYYFRFFSKDGKRINLLRSRDGALVENAGIRKQCSKSYFYGDEGAEDAITNLEHAFRPALSTIKSTRQIGSDWDLLLGALLFQKTRSNLERERPREVVDRLMRLFLKAEAGKLDSDEKRELLLRNLDRVSANPRHYHTMTMVNALVGAAQLRDLHAVLVSTSLERPFVFSDAPVVFFNEAAAHIAHSGSYGVACSGLQIVCPIDPTLLLFLYDPACYVVDGGEGGSVEVTSVPDVDAFNRLQLYHSLSAVYFHDWADREYLQALWEAEKTQLSVPKSELRTGKLVSSGIELGGELLHIFDPPLATRLKLSFVESIALPDDGSVKLRDPERASMLLDASTAFLDGIEKSRDA